MDNLANRKAADDMPDDSLNISDVIEVIETDPDFNSHPKAERIMNPESMRPAEPKLNILVQPAPKALRFRYECEGRSAGSIPGANSTPENKTFPTIQIVDGAGIWKAVVVVSCVTKDPPYRSHPHKLVGREGCKKGVCTIEVPRDTMKVQFSNLGIQCVKKKDIEEALRTREEIRVDPFRQGFSHRNQPTSIDLNAVRLCFQGFIQKEPNGKYVELKPEVSEPIFDKKAMSDLVIVKLSDCVSPVDGGTKDIILLCEKVNKEDIQVRFYEEKNGVVVWEGFGEFQPSQVHKQTAIWFKPPKYHTKEVQDPVKVNVQLRRPSDGATSLPVPFQLLPLHAGRPAYWSLRHSFAKKRNYDIFNDILAQDTQLLAKRPAKLSQQVVKPLDQTVSVETQTNGYTFVDTIKEDDVICSDNTNDNDHKDLNTLLVDQVVDELYAETKRNAQKFTESDEKSTDSNLFDDTKSYTSLQLAFKNPVEITDNSDKYEDVISPETPLISITSTKAVEEVEKLPPLPPKRIKKADTPQPFRRRPYSTDITNVSAPNLNEMASQNLKSDLLKKSDANANFKMERPKSQSDLSSSPMADLPPTPCSTLPKPKKRKFLSGLFSYLSKDSKSSSRATTPSKRNSFSSSKSLQIELPPTLNRSPSTKSSSSSVHIPLKDAPPESTGDLNQNRIDVLSSSANGNILVDNFEFNLDLTEAEHYALYTAIAPHATQSEFDETSCYYAPVEGGKILGEPDIQMRFKDSTT